MKGKIRLPHHHNDSTELLIYDMPDDDVFIETAAIFSLISDTTRLKILWLLFHSEDCVINIAAAIEMSSPAVSHHLRILKQSGLIVSRKDGKEVYYTKADTPRALLAHKMVDRAFQMKCDI